MTRAGRGPAPRGYRILSLRVVLIAALACSHLALFAQPPKLTRSDVEAMMKELSNWGRWGKDDQLGTIHLITPAVRRAAAALVKDGVSISISRPLDTQKAADNAIPFASRPMRDGDFLLDEYTVAYHGFAHTHMDSLAHMFAGGRGYNGVPAPTPERGPQSLTIANYSGGIFTRGVLVDLPRLKGTKYLEPGTAIYPADLDAWAARDKAAGLHASCARWLKQRDIALFASDGPGDVLPSLVEGVAWPLHQLLLIAMGTPMLDNCDLEALAEAAASRNRPTFLLVVAPLRVQSGTGSPVNPIATF